MYTVDYFIRKFEAIPEEKWLEEGRFFDTEKGAGCAYGWCGIRDDDDRFETPESIALKDLFLVIEPTVISTNDGEAKQYQQPTPKQRILAALYDIKKMQEPEMEEIPRPEPKAKEYRVVKVSETIYDQTLITTN